MGDKKPVNTSSLQWLKQKMNVYKNAVKKSPAPEGREWIKDSELSLTDLMIHEIDREIESNRKRSERTKKCIRKKQGRC